MLAKSVATIVGAAAMLASAQAQVTATGTMGSTNPPQATAPTAVNQTSYARLLSANSVSEYNSAFSLFPPCNKIQSTDFRFLCLDDFCIFAPPEAGVTIGDSEAYEVAW
jgi:hypothetical protein